MENKWREATMKAANNIRTTDNSVTWLCSSCDYRMTDVEMNAVRLDYGCPRCNNSFENFNLKVTQTTEGAGE